MLALASVLGAGAAASRHVSCHDCNNDANGTAGAGCVQVVRLWAGATHAEFEYTVGPIDWSDGWGKEVVTTYSTNLTTNATWWTDSNGRDSIVRIRDYRASWNYTVNQNVSGASSPVQARTNHMCTRAPCRSSLTSPVVVCHLPSQATTRP